MAGFKKMTNLDLKPVVSGSSKGSEQQSTGRDMWKKIESQVNAYAEQIKQDTRVMTPSGGGKPSEIG